MNLHDFRRDYLMGGLRRIDLDSDPFVQFERWFNALLMLEIKDPNAMVLATANAAGEVDQRIVLLKAFNSKGFDFYTNKQSHKARDISENPNVSLHFPWHAIERQIKVNGVAKVLSEKDNDTYFASRPRESQLAAWASAQSQSVPSREALMAQFEHLSQQYPNAVPRPPHWGGYRVEAYKIEFWQGGANRLHDRFVYSRQDEKTWSLTRLSP